ncbi:protein FAM166C [Aquila chrysaetos chrysaetos]|uniref:protein FAM166C n=1 Tax=Aquila chrysaetos chrysaetos TaxID=223781 RepID=UPI0005D06716|nr:protein FAM166C [Aquila chrysaetos chrysaetos]
MRYPQGPQTVMACQAGGRDPCPCTPLHTRFSLDGGRSQELSRFYQLTQQHREFYRDKSGMLYVLPYFVLPSKEKERYPHPLDLPPLSAKTRWHLLRVSLVNLRTYQTFPSGKRVTSQERETRDSFFEYRA